MFGKIVAGQYTNGMSELEFMKDIVVRASQLITDDVIVKAKDEHGDLVTNFDLAIETMITAAIKQNYPDFAIVSEEYHADQALTRNCFTVDPIDGTINFAHGLPLWGIQMACVRDGQTCAAVIYLPKLQELYWADATGSYLNGKPIHVSQLSFAKSVHIVCGKNYFPILVQLQQLSPHGRHLHSSAVDYALVAKGSAGTSVIVGADTVWDYLPGEYLVQQAGGYIDNQPGLHLAANTAENGAILKKLCLAK